MKVLVTGGSGLIGNALTARLRHLGHEVVHLSTGKPGNKNGIPVFHWDPAKETWDNNCLEGITHVVHLAGAPIAKRWTPAYKQEILRSRVSGTALLRKKLLPVKDRIQGVICASGVGYYPSHPTQLWMEEDGPGEGFLQQVVIRWENEIREIERSGLRTAWLRTGFVLAQEGGALPAMAVPHRLGLGAAFGDGKQQISWIHLNDLVSAYIHLLEHPDLSGPFNAVTGQISNRELNRLIALVLKKPFFLPALPAFLIRLLLGEMADLVLMSQKCSGEKLLKTGFTPRYTEAEEALRSFLGSNKKK